MRGKRHVWLAVYGANPITACGTLINLKFGVVDALGSSLMLNEASPAAHEKSGKVVVRRWCDNNLMIEKSKFDRHGPR